MDEKRSGFFESKKLSIKICGITNTGDAVEAVAAGADAVGINLFDGSKRHVCLADSLVWIREIPVTRIAVVVNACASLVQDIVASDVFDAIQFHGDESPDDCARCEIPWIRAVRVRSQQCLDDALSYQTPWILLDAFSTQGYGGTGSRVNWEMATTFIHNHPDRNVILAGGLTVQNVSAAVKSVGPFAVDVASGVESPGNLRRKAAPLMQEFVRLARQAATH